MVPKSVQVLQSHESLCDDTRMSAWDFLFSSGPVDTGKAQIVLAYVLKKNSQSCNTKSNQCQRYAYVYVEFFSILLSQNYCITPEIIPRRKISVKIVCSERVVVSPFYVHSISISTVAKYGSLGKWICPCKFLNIFIYFIEPISQLFFLLGHLHQKHKTKLSCTLTVI